MINVKIYTKRICPYCVSAKQLFNQKGVKYQEVDAVENVAQMQKETNNAKTVPQIIINGTLIGGYDDLKQLDTEGKLEVLLDKNN